MNESTAWCNSELHWNDDERIVEFKVMIRPFKGLQLVMGKMVELLLQPN